MALGNDVEPAQRLVDAAIRMDEQLMKNPFEEPLQTLAPVAGRIEAFIQKAHVVYSLKDRKVISSKTMMNHNEKKAPIKSGVPDHEDVNIVLHLYELRRETVMRQARDYMNLQFMPETWEDFSKLFDLNNPANAYLRQVTSYWEMAATFVNMGALHEELFWNTNGEAIFFYAKVQPFLERIRKDIYGPQYMTQLETLIQRRPDGADRLKMINERLRKLIEMKKGAR